MGRKRINPDYNVPRTVRRLLYKLSKEEIADHMGVHDRTVHRWLVGERMPATREAQDALRLLAEEYTEVAR